MNRSTPKTSCHTLFLLLPAALLCYAACTMHPREANAASERGEDTTRKEARLVFAGDLMQHMPQVRAAQRGNGHFDYSECFRYVKPLFEQADYAILNFETTLTPTTDYHGFPTFRSPGAVADALRDIGIDAVVLAITISATTDAQGSSIQPSALIHSESCTRELLSTVAGYVQSIHCCSVLGDYASHSSTTRTTRMVYLCPKA